MAGETLLACAFAVVVVLMMAIDLGVFNRREHEIGFAEALVWSVVWTVVALIFNGAIALYVGATKALEFFTGYVVERALSFDNLFVFVLVFRYFGLPVRYQHHTLFWGVVGALLMRALFIGVGAALVARFEWILYCFGVVLLYSGGKMLKHESVEVHPDQNVIVRSARKLFPVSSGYESKRFLVRKGGVLYLTPMLLALITIETTDLVFAVDSIPAVFGVTHDPFIAFTSNIFAVLGLRASYFLLSSLMTSFEYLGKGLAAVLMFIGCKMVVTDVFSIPIGVSLGVVALILVAAVVASVLKQQWGSGRN